VFKTNNKVGVKFDNMSEYSLEVVPGTDGDYEEAVADARQGAAYVRPVHHLTPPPTDIDSLPEYARCFAAQLNDCSPLKTKGLASPLRTPIARVFVSRNTLEQPQDSWRAQIDEIWNALTEVGAMWVLARQEVVCAEACGVCIEFQVRST
jgi:hypothetical protein